MMVLELWALRLYAGCTKFPDWGAKVCRSENYTLLETNMETQKGTCEDYSPSKLGLYGFPC